MPRYAKPIVPPCLYGAQDRVLETGEHFGHKWAVGYNGLGVRTGYVKIPSGHPWQDVDLDDIPAEVHGGLTYYNSHPNSPNHWIGFDCGHYGDAADPALCDSAGLGSGVRRMMATGIVRDQNYVVMQCRRLCEQAAMAALKET